MKNILPLLILILFTACSKRKDYHAEEYQQLQKDYESEKLAYTKGRQKSDNSKQQFFIENKALLMRQFDLFDQIATEDFDQVNNDTTYFKGDVLMRPVNFGHIFKKGYRKKKQEKIDLPVSNVIFLNHVSTTNANGIHSSYSEDIKSCLAVEENDFSCLNEVTLEKIEEVLSLEYIFILDEKLRVEPELQGNNFSGGVFAANLVCYDIKKREPVFSFFVVANSSEEVKTNGTLSQGPKKEIQLDFKNNIKKGVLEACRKHFQFSENISFFYNI